MFEENKKLEKGLQGERRVTIRLDKVEGVSQIQGTFNATYRYVVAYPLGFTKLYKERITTTFDITL